MTEMGPSPRGYSRIQSALECEQKWHYEANGIPELGVGRLSSATCEDYFALGSAYHEAMRARFRGGATADMLSAAIECLDVYCNAYPNLNAERQRLMEYIAAMIGQYVEHYGETLHYAPLHGPKGPMTELALDVTLPNQMLMTVRIDLVAVYSVMPCVVDFKTTSEDIASYLRRYDLDAKTTGYVYAMRQNYPEYDIRSAYIEVVKKPRKNAKSLVFEFGGGFTQRTDRELERWAIDTMTMLRQMDDITQGKRLAVRNTRSCISAYGKVCVFKPLCKYGWESGVSREQFKINGESLLSNGEAE